MENQVFIQQTYRIRTYKILLPDDDGDENTFH